MGAPTLRFRLACAASLLCGGAAAALGFPLGDGHALKITFTGGGLIVYGATVDNMTNDPSAQFLAYRILVA